MSETINTDGHEECRTEIKKAIEDAAFWRTMARRFVAELITMDNYSHQKEIDDLVVMNADLHARISAEREKTEIEIAKLGRRVNKFKRLAGEKYSNRAVELWALEQDGKIGDRATTKELPVIAQRRSSSSDG